MIDPSDALSELLGRYAGEKLQISKADIARWTGGSADDECKFYDLLARLLARGYHEQRYTFEFCDQVVNELYDLVLKLPSPPSPDLFWHVFAAFDAGEFHREPDMSDDPIADFTDPEIANIVSNL
jgi:hypothetical protein